MAIKGELEHLHPIELLQILRDNRETGILVVDVGNGYIGMYFVDGKIAFAFRADRAYDLFTQKLVKDFVTALKTKDAALFSRLIARIKSSIAAFVSSTKGTFSFEKANFFVDDDVKEFLMSTERIIISESKRISDPEILERKISSDEMVFRKVKGADEMLSQVQFDADDYRVFDAVDGKRTVAEIIEYTGLPPIKVKQRLFGFLCAGLIQRAPRRAFRLADFLSVKLVARLIKRLRGMK